MSLARAFLVIALLVAVAVSGIANQPVSAQNRAAYIALGDSIAYGVGSSLPERRSYPALVRDFLQQHTGEPYVLANLAIPGETAASFLADGQASQLSITVASFEEQRTPIDLVTLSLGGNEMLAQRYGSTVERQQALAEFRDSLGEAVPRIRSEVGSETTLILTTYYDLSEGDSALSTTDAWWIEEFNQIIRQTASDYDALTANVDEAFRGRIGELTLAPYDIHPGNQGYRAIAEQVWATLELDTQEPDIQVISSSTASRRTPTLQFEVTDDQEVTSVSVQVGDGPGQTPVHIGNGRYALLLDLRNDDVSEYQIFISAEDAAGNSNQVEVLLTIASN